MPEGPELRIAANFINQVASKHLFTGKVIKSDLATKLCEVPFEVKHLGIWYNLLATGVNPEDCEQ